LVFSEGRTLCVRIARPYGLQGLSLPPVVRREACGLMGMHEEAARPPQRACGARPSAKPEPGQGEPAASKARCIGKSRCRRYGRAEPAPPGGGLSKLEWPCGEGQEMAPRAVFSEGRTLCVRIAGSYGWQGFSLPPEVTQEAGNLNGKRLGRTQAFPSQPDGDRDLGCFLRRGLEVFGNGSDISPPLFLDLHEMGLIFDTMCAKVPIIIMSVCQVSGLS
jgi:hypothetical protein